MYIQINFKFSEEPIINPCMADLHDDCTIDLKLSGLNCAACVAKVESSLAASPGVEEATVSLTQARATVRGQNLDADELAEAVIAAGYGATVLVHRQTPAELGSELEERQQQHEREWRRRAVLGLGVAVPMFLLHWTVHAPWTPWVLLVLATFVVITVGTGFYVSAWKAALNRTTNMDTLISIGASTAYVFSLVLFILELIGIETGQPMYFTEAAALFGIISLGHWFEARSSAKAGSAVRELLELQPETAERLEEDGSTREVPSVDVQPGDRLLIRPGARVPIDGIVLEGQSDLDESVVTGEPIPVQRSVNDPVVSGSMNTTGRLVIEARVDGRNTTIARIAELVTGAMASKTEIQRLADKVSSIFVPTILLIAIVTLVGWSILAITRGDALTFQAGVIAVVTVLIISCPCALGLATPMAIMVGASESSRMGILIKSAPALEITGSARHVIFDKTGTLTVGRPRVTKIELIGSSHDESMILRLAAAVEASSEHPLARALVEAAVDRGLDIPGAEEFKATAGHGVVGRVDGQLVEVGRDDVATCRVLIDETPVARVTMSDEPRADASGAVAAIGTLGLQVHMLSGDRHNAAMDIASRVGIEAGAVHAEQTPEEKTEFIHSLEGGTIMVGDGINDAGALAMADVGVSLGTGTNIAVETASIVVPGEQVQAIPTTIATARETLRVIKQNLFFAFVYNSAMVPLAALGLLGTWGPLLAAGAMGISDITVIGNAIRLRGLIRRRAAQSTENS